MKDYLSNGRQPDQWNTTRPIGRQTDQWKTTRPMKDNQTNWRRHENEDNLTMKITQQWRSPNQCKLHDNEDNLTIIMTWQWTWSDQGLMTWSNERQPDQQMTTWQWRWHYYDNDLETKTTWLMDDDLTLKSTWPTICHSTIKILTLKIKWDKLLLFSIFLFLDGPLLQNWKSKIFSDRYRICAFLEESQ